MTERKPGAGSYVPLKPAAQVLGFLVLFALSFCCGIADSLFIRCLCATLAASIFAFHFVSAGVPYHALAVLLSFVSVWVYSGESLAAAWALLPLVGGTFLSVAMLYHAGKTPSVIATGAGMILGCGFLFFLQFVSENGTASFTAMLESYTAYFDGIADELNDLTEQMTEAVAVAAAETASSASSDSVASYSSYFTPDVIKAVVDLLRIIAPSFAVIGGEVCGYVAVTFVQLLARLFGNKMMFPPRYEITMSPVSAIVYVICYVVVLLSSSTSLAEAVCQNLILILMPGLFIMGLHSLRDKALDSTRRRSFIMSVIFLLMAAFLSPAICLIFIVLDGIGEIIRQAMSEWKKQ